MLAAWVPTALARLGREQEVVEHRQRFRDFCSAELAEAIEHRPKLLDGERRTITILFSDIRGFARLSENLSPEDTCALVRDVMERLTVRIREHQGVVVDYLGDVLLALWNAPATSPTTPRPPAAPPSRCWRSCPA